MNAFVKVETSAESKKLLITLLKRAIHPMWKVKLSFSKKVVRILYLACMLVNHICALFCSEVKKKTTGALITELLKVSEPKF